MDELTRRDFIKASIAVSGGAMIGVGLAEPDLGAAAEPSRSAAVALMSDPPRSVEVTLTVNGVGHRLDALEANTTLLDCLRDQLHLTGSKKGCGLGHCGACTVLVEGRRVNSCLALAVMQQGKQIETIEGLAKEDALHPVQAAFVEHDGFQCGYCTPGQIMSAVACIREGHAGTDVEVREWMSGNLCRCGAYTNIVAAVRQVAQRNTLT